MDPGSISLNDIGDPFLRVCDEADGIFDIGVGFWTLLFYSKGMQSD